MHYPDFYIETIPIRLYDPLSEFLGAFEKGELEISYLDCVKFAGHSCPTVAGAYLMASRGLSILFNQSLPSRGFIKVEMKNSETEGVTGVIGNTIAFIVGAGGKGGFKGIQNNFSRDNLITYGTPMQGEVRLTRLDTNENVELSYNPSIIMPDPMMQILMEKNLQGIATENDKKIFRKLWQKRVEEILLSVNLHDKMITVYKGDNE